jgi:hypothetical protein
VSTLHDAIGSGNNTTRLEQLIHDHKSIIQIKNTDHTCFQRAFIIGKAHAVSKKKYDNGVTVSQLQVEQAYNNYKNFRRQLTIGLELEVQQLCEYFEINERPCGIEDIRNIQHNYPDYQVCVMEGGSFQWTFMGEQDSEKKTISYIEIIPQ